MDKGTIKQGLKRLIYRIYKFTRFDYFNNIICHQKLLELRGRFKEIGDNSYIPLDAQIANPQFISIGKNFFSLKNLRIDAITEYVGIKYKPTITIGDDVCFNANCHIGAIDRIEIGYGVLLASNIYISDHYHGEINDSQINLPPIARQLFTKGPVIIKDNVWIGDGVCILPGVTIGENAIIGANSVVNKNIPANAVVGGVPARIIKMLR